MLEKRGRFLLWRSSSALIAPVAKKGLDDEKLILVLNVLQSFVFEESLVVPLEDKIRNRLRHCDMFGVGHKKILTKE